jgi:hypothetical protein
MLLILFLKIFCSYQDHHQKELITFSFNRDEFTIQNNIDLDNKPEALSKNTLIVLKVHFNFLKREGKNNS